MNIDLKQIKALITLCRKQGVSRLSVDGLTIDMGLDAHASSAPAPSRTPRTASRKAKAPSQGVEQQQSLPDGDSALTDEELLFWSAAGPSVNE